MTPLALLRTWRQRWEILADVPERTTAYFTLDQADWGVSLASLRVWSSKVMTSFATLLGLVLLALAGLMVFGIDTQITLGVFAIALAIYIRRYRGLFGFLALGGLALLCGVRYLSWRWQYTLPGGMLYPFGVCLLLVEILAFVAFVIWLANTAWPLNQDPVGMPESEQDWPYIDILLVAPRAGLVDLAELAATLDKQRWPTARMRVFVQDARADRELQAACRPYGFTYVDGYRHTALSDRPLSLDAALPPGNGEYVLVFEADAYAELRADPLLLQRWAAWLRNDPALGVLYTPDHPMAPTLSISVEELLLERAGGTLALIRRVAWKRHSAGGLDNFVERLDAANYCTALVGHPQRVATAVRRPQAVTWVRIDDVGDGHSVLQRQRLSSASQFRDKLLPWLLRAMALGVLAIPVTGILLVQAPLLVFAAYVVPYAAMMFLAWSDTPNLRRLDIGSEIREWMLALVLPLIVAGKALFVLLQRRLSHVETDQDAARSAKLYFRLAVCLILLILAVARLVTTSNTDLLPWLAVVIVAIFYEIALTLSRWASGQEARSLRHTFATQECTLVAAGGKSIVCRTRNFPQQPLQLDFDEDVSHFDA
ncbi:MAG: glycosyltransferase, partial [Dokdonella sp.]